MDEFSKTRDAEIQEVLNDLPARLAKTTIVWPRATHMPGEVNSRQARTNMAEVAAQTLAGMGEFNQTDPLSILRNRITLF
jgi:hypothetical protein